MMDLLQRAEAALLWVVYHGLLALPLDRASRFGGVLMRAIGPLLPQSRRARRSLELALPGCDHRRILRDMWENLGRMAGEYPHSLEFARDPARMELVGAEPVLAMRAAGQPMLFFSGHIGNWELTYPLMARLDIHGAGVFRAPNNPHVSWLFDRAAYPHIGMIPKGAAGARKSIEVLNAGKSLAMFVDQKMNDGIEAPFFGRPAMTAPALASLALKFGYPVVPFRVVRTEGAYFRVEFGEPIHFQKSGDRAADLLAVMTRVNRILEGWISEYPAQWLWLHRRWGKELYRA
ncbi:MAG TPA: lauroyl acyltransferase [Magnetospirillaceae bacterium]|nr:lauroyl acyltransferase [Magnetospirillaceae bacterium]